MIKQKWPFSSAENTALTLTHNYKKFALFDKYGPQMKSVASYVYLYKRSSSINFPRLITLSIG